MRKRARARYTRCMPLLPPDKPAAGRSANPARIMLSSPLAAATRARVYHQRHRSRSPEHGLRVLAMIGSLLVHLLFLFAFVLGPAYELAPPPPSKEQFLQVRLVEPPEPPPPPPVRGTPPKELGPRHQGRRSPAVSSSERSANAQAAAAPTPAAAKPVIAAAAKPRTEVPKPLAAAPAPVSLPKPAPVPNPETKPLPPAGEPPQVALPTLTLRPPAPPKFQPEPVRAPQLEGNQPMPPPASLTLTRLPPQAPSISVPNIALQIEAPKTTAPVSVVPNQAPPAAPPVPRQQPVPLPAQPSPQVNLQNAAIEPTPLVPRELPHVQLPAITLAPTELPPVPLPAAPPAPQPPAPAEKIETLDTSSVPAIQPSIQPPVLRPSVAAPTTVASAVAPAPTPASQPAESPSPAPAEPSATRETTPSAGDLKTAPDLSSAPNATPQGSDYATPGEPTGVAEAPPSPAASVAVVTPSPAGQGRDNGQRGKLPGAAGQTGGNQPGAAQGERQGELGGYVQLKPHGDTKIMSHGVPNIGYRPTRFEQDWTPEGESSIDTALRHAVEKTTVKHTFHLPRGIRVQCAVMPLLPMSLLGCRNPDPPPRPVAEKVYERLHLAPANPLVPPAPAASIAPAPMVKFDNAAECAAARVAGGPPPPGCEAIVLPVRPASPASSSSSWVPASDQFH